MFSFARLMIMALVALTVVFVSLWFYFRTAKRDKLELEWHEKGMPTSKENYVGEAMQEYDGSLKKRLIWGVYVVPSTLIAILIYVTNNA